MTSSGRARDALTGKGRSDDAEPEGVVRGRAHLFSVADHPYFGKRLDAYATVGFGLGRTERISGVVTITNPARTVILLARTVSSLAALSGGRVVLGIGAGGSWDAIASLGVTRLTPALAARASLPVAALQAPAPSGWRWARARTLAGKPAAGSTQRRKRSVFCNALGYAVEQGHLAANPVDRIQWTTPAVAATVGSSSAPPRPASSSPPSGDSATGERTWKRSAPACTTPPCDSRRPSCSARPPSAGHRSAGAPTTTWAFGMWRSTWVPCH
jgi:Luciferase-like monooxygenase